ncbi:MAG: YdeI family protein [Candidatus Izemoplasmatales bacterium]
MATISVESWLQKNKTWVEETSLLRDFCLEKLSDEEIKWWKPTFSYDGKNVAIIQGFKNYIALMFFKGVLLKDEHHLLSAPGENSQTARQLRFKTIHEIESSKELILSYLEEAIDLEKNNVKIEVQKKEELVYPDELAQMFGEDPEFQVEFEKLTPGRRRAYILFFNGAKQSITRYSRIEKMKPQIMDGKGLND